MRFDSRLHRTALDVTEALVRDPRVRAVALTGSVARGDAGPGSDVDLWVLGDRTRREALSWHGVPVTLLWQTPRASLALDTLLRFEIEDVWVLHDPEALLRRVRMRYWRHRERLRELALHGSAQVLHELAVASAAVPPAPALALLAELARRAAALAVYIELGWRVPHWRHFERLLSARALRLLAEALALPSGPGWRRVLRLAGSPELAALRSRARDYPPPLPTLERLRWLGARGRRADAVLAVRAAFAREPAHGGAEHALWSAAHGFGEVTPAAVRTRARLVARLVGALGIEAHLDPRWRLRESLG